MTHARPALAAIAALALTLPAAASASTASIEPAAGDLGPIITYTAANNEANKVDLKVTGATVEIADPGATSITPGANCTAVNAKKVSCTNPNPTLTLYTKAELGNGNDTFAVAGVAAEVRGGPGSDDLNGGEHFDLLDGGGVGTDALHGGPGDDFLTDGDTTGASNKDTFDGGDGLDSADYRERTATVNVDLADAAGDGEVGEDDTLTSIERATGGSGNDVIRATDGPSILDGQAGNDELDGRGGDDIILGRTGNDLMIGGGGVDDIEGEEGDDTLRLDNPAGTYDRLTLCSSGNDTIVGIGPSPFVEMGCETGDFGFGYVAPLKPKKVGTSTITVRVVCPAAYKKDGKCKGSIVAEPKSAYKKDAAYRKAHRYGAEKFSISKSSSNVRIDLNSAGRKQLKKSAFKMQFQVNLKETATSTKRRFEWTSYVVKSFL
ncbi:MAG TPA: calcium-binding protein [Thermoleophilaceae bacterium]